MNLTTRVHMGGDPKQDDNLFIKNKLETESKRTEVGGHGTSATLTRGHKY